MSAISKTHDIGLFYGSTLHQKEKPFELGKQYELVKKHHNVFGLLYNLMDSDTFCGQLTDKAVGKVKYLFQDGHKVYLEVTKVHPMRSNYSEKLGREQVCTNGRGDCWSEADEQGKGPDEQGKGSDKGFDGEANPKSTHGAPKQAA